MVLAGLIEELADLPLKKLDPALDCQEPPDREAGEDERQVDPCLNTAGASSYV